MTTRILAVGAAILAVAALACVRAGGDEPQPPQNQPAATKPQPKKVVKSDAAWRRQLAPMQYYVTRRKGTEPAFNNQYWNYHGDGIYRCVCCTAPLFDSRTKFESGTGWPSFFAPLAKEAVRTAVDRSSFAIRTEVLCRLCDAHLGHVFRDGPPPTGLRYCMNSASLVFQDRAAAIAEAAARAIAEAPPEPAPEAKTEPPPAEDPGDAEPSPEPEATAPDR